jgi:type I restriction enzyme, S subunit
MVKQGYKQTDIGIIPEDWEVTSLGEIGFFKNGINKSKEDFGFGFPFVNLMDVFGKSSISTSKGFDFINSNNLERKLYNIVKNDVLFIRSSVKPSGVGLTSVITQDLLDVAFSGFIIRFRDNNYIELDYKKHCFFETNFRNRIIANSSVSANTNINQESLKSIQICLPKLRIEQIAIAKVLTDMDDLITNLTELIAKKKLIKVGAMQVLLTPKEDWEVYRLGSLLQKIIDNRGKTPPFTINGIPLIEVNSLGNCDIQFDKVSKFVSIETFNNWFREHLIVGDILFSTVGNTAITTIYGNKKGVIAQNIVGLRVKENFDSRFLYYLFNQKQVIKKFKSIEMSGVQPSLKVTQMVDIELQLPDFQTQSQISSILTDIDKEIQDLEAKLAKYKLIKIGAMQKLLTGEIRLV